MVACFVFQFGVSAVERFGGIGGGAAGAVIDDASCNGVDVLEEFLSVSLIDWLIGGAGGAGIDKLFSIVAEIKLDRNRRID